MTTAKLQTPQYTHPCHHEAGELGNSDGFVHLAAEMSIQRNKTTLIRIRLS